ncbi:right-handed parallel beta-helix repeat-containing protein [Rhodobacter capsulatus]|uniref:Right-handed parallel beta-helix repeat-containing protein n=1 Tax=Rhodobacter capsulatus TaxID=1061 RepID=A0A4U1JN42_RHOCA|nr:glycosyl hydrolase family 28-related protein [Rhodobacter capsulatus]TKD13850.1 right-handed parallel beta-helix repeat-containing protein [Rhodobacter capsulatus]
MNIAITDGVNLTPSAFELGLGQWSSENGTAGSATYAGAPNAALVPADADFGSCLELVKTQSTQKLRWMGQTPILPGVYLRITAKVKAVSGNFCAVRIAGYAMTAANAHVTGLTEVASPVTLTTYGKVVTVQAIVGSGTRAGVDMAWGTAPAYGHFGLDLTGQTGGVVRIEDIVIEDITEAFLRDLMDVVDVRDYGARGDGTTDDRAAFLAADAAADGRSLVVPEGSYRIASSLSIDSPIRFTGTLSMPTAARLVLQKNFDFPTYAKAFGNEELGLKKGLQALLSYTDNNIFDLCGRRVDLTAPIDVKAAVPDTSSWANRRVLANGQISVSDGTAWNTVTVTSNATYSTSQSTILSNVSNIANIPVGARVSGTGVGREVYVQSVDIGAAKLTLSQPLYGGSATRSYTFRRYKYALDFSGFDYLARFTLDNIEFLLGGIASGILLAREGETFGLRDCWMVKPRDRAITSIGRACQNLCIDRCDFLSNELDVNVGDRTSVCVNVNANDTKIRDSRFVRFGTTMVLDGTGHVIVGNHWFQGDGQVDGPRVPGLVFTTPNVQSTVTGNYIDNNFIEWTNEYSPDPNLGTQYSFGGLTMTGNTCIMDDVAAWVTWISIKPYGSGHYIQGLTVSNNVFKALNGNINRIEKVDTSFADLDYARMRNITFQNNIFNAVTQMTVNPVMVQVTQSSAQSVWSADAAAYLPFGGWARHVESLVAVGAITNAAGARVSGMPFITAEQGAGKNLVNVTWPEAAKGKINVVIRIDTPN